MTAILKWYASLPRSIQLLLTTLESAVVGVVIAWLSTPGLSLNSTSLHQLEVSIGGAVTVALVNWFKHSPLQGAGN